MRAWNAILVVGRTYRKALLGFVWLLSVTNCAFGAEVLFISGSFPATSADQILVDRLTNSGHQVTVVDDSASQTSDDFGKDLILISSSVVSSAVGDKFALSTIPIVVWEAWIYDDMGMTGGTTGTDFGGEFNQQSIMLTGNHTLTNFLQGATQISTSNNRIRWGVPNGNAKIAATIAGDSSKPVMFVYDAGSIMVNGVAPARRIGWFFDNGTPSNWNSAAQALFDNLIVYALSPNDNQPPSVTATAPTQADVDDSVSLEGMFTDDQLTSSVNTEWTVEQSPPSSNVVFGDSFSLLTTADFDTEGSYQIKLSVDDGEFVSETTLNIEIVDEPPPPDPTGSDILFVVALPANQSDQNIASYLTAAGHTVTLIDDNQVVESDAQDQDLVVISSTVFSGNVNTTFTNTAIPVLVWESALFDDFGLTGLVNRTDYGPEANQLSINVIGGSVLSAGLSGSTQIATSPQSVRWGIPSPNAEISATLVGNASRATIFSYEVGSAMVSGTAPARRTAFFLGDDTALSWTPQGQALFDAAINWLLATPNVANQPPQVDAGTDRQETVNIETTLSGSFVDDGVTLPVTANWFVLQTPAGGTADIADLNNPNSTVTFTLEGEYILELEVSDTEFTETDTVTFTVLADVPEKDILLVTGANPIASADERILFQLENILGLNVQVISQFAVSESDANNKDAVLISSTVWSTTIGTMFTNTSVPVLTWEAALLDDLGMSNTGGSRENGVSEIDVIGSGHPLAAGKSGTVTISTLPESVTYGIPLASAEVIATSSTNASRARIFAYEVGANLTSITAPARRAYIYLYEDGHSSWTAEAQDLFNAMVKWTLNVPNLSHARIMPLGDSITRGKNFTWSYRETLSELLDADQCRYDFVGTQSAGDPNASPPPPNPALFDPDHEGHGGFRTDQIDAALNGYLAGNVPDVALIHLGTNDITQGTNLNQAKENLRSIIAKLRIQNSSVEIYLAQIIKRAPSFDAVIASYNSLMSDLAVEEDTPASPVILVDHATGYNNSVHNQSDQLHPNEAGDDLIAANWFTALRPNLGSVCAP